MLKRIFFFLLICFLSYDSFAQLKKISKPNLYSEADLYQDDAGSLYSTVMRIKFSQKTIDLGKGKKIASFDEVLVNEVKTIFQEVKKRYGNFVLIKEFPSSAWGDTIGVHIVTKEKVKLKDLSQFYELKFDRIICVDSIKTYLKGSRYLESVYGPFKAVLTFEPDDYSSSEQWDLAKIEAPKAWDITRGTEEVKIGISDAWLSGNNPDDIHYELRGSKFVHVPLTMALGHGSQVTGVAGGLTNNNLGIASIGFNSKLLLSFAHPSWIDSLRLRGAHIINCSWFNPDGDQLDLRHAIYNCLNTGVIITAGAGNDQSNVDPIGTIPVVPYPAAYNFPSIGKQVIAVTATSIYNSVETFGWPPNGDWNYSKSTDPINDSTNSFVDFAAPGVFIKVLNDLNNYGYTTASGTSLSSPMVAGLLGLIKSIYPALAPEIAYTILKNSSEKVGYNDYSYVNNAWSPRMGYGRINAYKALKYTVENYGGTFNQNVTIPASDTWNLQPGVTLTFVNGAALIVNGTLNAVGTSSSRITFTRSGSSGTWGGIQFNSGSNGNLQYCTIQNASYGIYCNNSSPTLDHCTINYCGTGIYIKGSLAQPSITQNYIEADTACVVHYNGGNGNLTNNSFRNAIYGVYDISGSPRYDYNNVGRNKFESSITRDRVKIAAGQPWVNMYQYFTVPISTTYKYINNLTANTIMATYNYWTGSLSGVYFGGNVDRSNPLPSEPTNPAAGPNWSLSKNSGGDFFAAFDKASKLFYEGKYSEARDNFKLLTKQYLDSEYSSYALNWYMLATEQIESIEKQVEYLNTIKQNKSAYTNTRFYALKWQLQNELRNGTKDTAKKLVSEVEVDSLYEREIMLDLAMGLYEYKGDKTGAEEVLNNLSQSYKDDNTSEAISFVKREMGGKLSLSNPLPENPDISNKEAKEDLSFVSVQNYPNPFNPSTTISYTLPEDGRVSIKVFDVLGREVTTLLDEFASAGKHNVVWDGTNFASGIYFYNILFKGQMLNKKMLLVK